MFEYNTLKDTLNKNKHQNSVHIFHKNKYFEQIFEENENIFTRETYLEKFKINKKNNKKNHGNKNNHVNYPVGEKTIESSNNVSLSIQPSINILLPKTCYFLKSNTFISCLLVLSDPNFHLLSHNSKRKEISKLKETLFINLDNYYKKFFYKKKGFDRSKMQSILTNDKPLDYPSKYYLCNFYERNIFIFDTITNYYELITDYDKEHTNNLFIKTKNVYQIVLNEEPDNNIPYLDKIMKDNFTKKYSFEKNIKHNWNKYKISELREIASQNFISLDIENTDKKKKKSEIILELKKRFN